MGGASVIHINYFESQVDEVYFPQLDIVADIARSIETLAERLEKNPNWDFSYYELVKKEVDENLTKMSDDTRFPIPASVSSSNDTKGDAV